jgi:hypothetical protein
MVPLRCHRRYGAVQFDAAARVSLAAGGSGGLPVTGTSFGLIGGAAAVLVVAGTMLTLPARRRRTRS